MKPDITKSFYLCIVALIVGVLITLLQIVKEVKNIRSDQSLQLQIVREWGLIEEDYAKK